MYLDNYFNQILCVRSFIQKELSYGIFQIILDDFAKIYNWFITPIFSEAVFHQMGDCM